MGKKLLAQVPVGTIVDERFNERAPEFATAAQGTKADGAAQKGQNLSDLADKAAARTALDVYSKGQAATAAQGTKADAALPAAARGAADGVASLVGGKVPAGQVPLSAIAQSDEVHNELAAETNRDGSPFRVALTRSARKPVGVHEQFIDFAAFGLVSSDGNGGNVTANNSAASFLRDWINANPEALYGKRMPRPVVLPGGYYRFDTGQLDFLSANVSLIGSGAASTIIGRKKDATGDLVKFGGERSSMRDIGFDGARFGDSPGLPTVGDLVVVNAGFFYAANWLIMNGPREGIVIGRDAASINSKVGYGDIRKCAGHGMRVTGVGTTDTESAHINIGQCGLSGFRGEAASGSAEVIHSWGNGIEAPAGSTDYDGIIFLATGWRAVNCEGETNIGAGLSFRTAAHRGSVKGGKFWGNNRQGISIVSANDGIVEAALLYQNGIPNGVAAPGGGSTGASFAGMQIADSAGWSIHGNKGKDFLAAVAPGDYSTANGWPSGYAPVTPFLGRSASYLSQSRHIVETGTSDSNIIIGNNIRGVDTRSGTGLVTVGANTISAPNLTV